MSRARALSVSAGLLACFGLLSWLGNMAAVSLAFGVHFVFGSVVSLIAGGWLGPRMGIGVALLGAGYTWILWGQPYAIVIFVLETAVTVWLYHRQRRPNLVIANLLYWLFLGIPLTALFYAQALDMQREAVMLVAVKQAINGVVNALLAGWFLSLIQGYGVRLPGFRARPLSLSVLLFQTLMILMLAAGSIPLLYGVQSLHQEQAYFLKQRLLGQAELVEQHLLQNPSMDEHVLVDSLKVQALALEGGIALLDEAGHALAVQGWLMSLASVSGLHALEPDFFIWLPDTGVSAMQRWREGQYRLEYPVSGHPVVSRIVMEFPAAELVDRLAYRRLWMFLFMGGLVVVAVVLTHWASQWLMRPLNALQETSVRVSRSVALGQAPYLPRSTILEYDILRKSLQGMAERLVTVIRELHEAQRELALKVEARTADLSRMEAMLNSLFSAAVSLVIVAARADGRITLFNRGAEALLGYRSHELIGRGRLESLIQPSELCHQSQVLSGVLQRPVTSFEALIWEAREEGAHVREWSYVPQRGEPIPMSVVLTAIYDEQRELVGYLSIAQDIRERRRVERLKTELVSTVSHELRTPLTSIMGALGLVVGGALGELDSRQQAVLRVAHENGQRLVSLINDLLDLDKLVAGKMTFELRDRAVDDLLNRSIAANEGFAQSHQVKLCMSSVEPEVFIRVDDVRFQQIMSNLISNAVKFSPMDGVVAVRGYRDGSWVRIEVRDCGPGIPEVFKARIFEKFAQADASDTRQKGGTGLGLAITRELVEQMGGHIGFVSGDQGTVFHVLFSHVTPTSTKAGSA